MKIKSLHTLTTKEISTVFMEAFEGYFVKMPDDHDYYKERWGAEGVNFEYSFGMFDESQLVGFILIAVDERFGKKTAFNSGTGVIPSHRGQRIVQQLYDHALPIYKKEGVEKCSLEVIVENEIAIKAYKKAGMEITKTYKIYSGDLDVPASNFELKEIDKSKVEWNSLPNQKWYSWGYQIPVCRKAENKFYEVWKEGKQVAYFIFNEATGRIYQVEILENQSANWEATFAAIQSLKKSVSIVNIDTRRTELIDYLEKFSLKNVLDQFEMEMVI